MSAGTPSCTIVFANGSTITPDTYENYSPSLESESPDIPTEQATINSNIIRQPRKCSIDLVFTPFPALPNMIPQAGADRPRKAVDAIFNAWSLRQTCDVLISGALYSPAILSVTWAEDQTDTITIRCQVKELLIASSASVKVKPTTSKLKKATGKKKVAVQPTRAGLLLAASGQLLVGNFLQATAIAAPALVP